ncbi:hypothetical protein J4E81_003678 [Alternaria sp. BMP 2799]|nr:hypothetical protein J4E81_003678 [Alternaria sp. BMP 2799]
MAPNHPDLTLSVGMRPVKSDIESDSSSDDEVADESNPAHANLKRRRTGENKRKRLADSGSDIDLVSPQFALDRNLEIHPSEHTIELADGSHIVSYGFVRTSISLGTNLDSADAPHSKVATIVDCFVLEGLSQDIILGEQTLDELRIFTENQHALVLASDTNAAMELNRIHSLGKTLTWFKKKLNPTSNQIITDGQ